LIRIIIFLLIIPLITIASDLSDAANSLSVGESIKLTTSNLTTAGKEGGISITTWSNTANWDSIRNVVVFIGKQAGSHRYYRLEYNEASNAWSNDSSLHSDLESNNSGHGYDHNAMDYSTGDIYFRLYNSVVYKWTASTTVWSKLADMGGSENCCEALEWWNDKGLVYSDVYGVEFYSGGSWTDAGLSPSGIGYHSIGEYQPNADVYVFGGGNSDSDKLYRVDADTTMTQLTNAPFGLGNAETSQGILVHDPNSNYYIAWDQADSWYQLDAVNDTWTSLNQSSGDGSSAQTGTPNMTDGNSLACPINEYGVIMFFGTGSNDVWLYKHSEAAADSSGTNSGQILQTFTLTPDTTDDCAFTVGLGFGKGDCNTPTLDLDYSYQLEVKKTWNDGSVKHAVASGIFSGTANTAKTINVYSSGSQPTDGDTLTEADIVTAAPSATVGLSGIDTISLADLLGSPVRTWISGRHMVEAHYRQKVSDAFTIWFHVRLYSSDDIWIRSIINYGAMGITSTDSTTYTPTIIIGSNTVYNSSTIQHEYTRLVWDGWIGNSPDIEIIQDCDYLEESGLVPNYWKEGGSVAGLNKTYTPGTNQSGDWSGDMGDTGYQQQIGLLPKWDALYVSTDGDTSAFKAVEAQAKLLNNYAICWMDTSNGQPIILRNWPNWSADGENQGDWG